MLKKVAAKFTESQVEWLAQQPEFSAACGSSESPAAITDIGYQLLQTRKPVHKPASTFNGISIPDTLIPKPTQ